MAPTAHPDRAHSSLSVAERAVLTTPHVPGFALSVSELFKPSV